MMDAIDSYLFGDLATDRTTPRVVRERIANGDFGVKSGRGFFEWTDERARAVRAVPRSVPARPARKRGGRRARLRELRAAFDGRSHRLPFPLAKVDQVALVVRDLDAAVREYWERLGIGTRRGDAPPGRPRPRSSRSRGEDRGSWLRRDPGRSGPATNGEGGFAYFETDGLLGALIEFIELPRQRTAAASPYPPDVADRPSISSISRR